MYKPDFKELDKLTEEGYLRKVISPCGKLMLYNYTDKCTFDRHWNEHTLNSRGTVYEISTGKVVAKAFPKFFNFGELDELNQGFVLGSEDFTVYEKMDGSLGIVYYYDGEWRVNTRGSFTSDQATKGKEILYRWSGLNSLYKERTYLVEIIYPENRIIVDYKDSESLVLLAAYDGNVEVPVEEADVFEFFEPCPVYYVNNIKHLQEHLETLGYNEEGYVVKLGNGYRVKFKSAEYLRLARIMSNMSPLAFWEKMENGIVQRDFLEQLPEEFREECDKVADTLEERYQQTLSEIVGDFEICLKSLGYEPDPVTNEMRKGVGLYLKENKPEHSGAIFPYLLGQDQALEKYIMKTIRPRANIL